MFFNPDILMFRDLQKFYIRSLVEVRAVIHDPEMMSILISTLMKIDFFILTFILQSAERILRIILQTVWHDGSGEFNPFKIGSGKAGIF
jgi:hypothetical protein